MANTFFAPQLFIPNGINDLSFYQKGLNAEMLRYFLNDDGSFHVAELSINGALFHIHEQKKSKSELSPDTAYGTTVLVGLFVDDVDSVVQKAIAAGASMVSEPQTYDYGYRQAQFKDPFGHIWMIEKQVNPDQ